ncbi:S26 family signal peptidase [Brevundimonas goettingensis]|uniref:S26 family signal peptidase n=1 Tax=Brevundimonas goettingensis TaxID=2774190 RepID=A0A975BYW7_9CAUL|nr:S26 family signal peptidase [Brevundimonas goettingensis]QTC90298.1 S26 family signal peptidase [Brevundimonas goettingensis]
MTRSLALGATLAGALLMWAPVDIPLPTLLVWNASASAPIGLYRVDPVSPARVGDRVVTDHPPQVADLLAMRGYLPLGVPLIKTVAAVAPARVCRSGETVSIDGTPVAEAKRADRLGRPLPAWSGCRILAADEVFLLTADVADSLDGRYFGPSAKRAIRGVAHPIHVRERRP